MPRVTLSAVFSSSIRRTRQAPLTAILATLATSLGTGCADVSPGSVEGLTSDPEDQQVAFVKIVAGGTHSCAVTLGGVVLCAGSNAHGELGLGAVDANPHGVPARVPTDLLFVDLAAGATHTCGIAGGAELYCWGSNTSGQLGDGTTVLRESPTRVPGNYVSVSAYQNSTCAVAIDRRVFCWGSGERGKLGNRDHGDTSRPHLVADSLDFRSADVGRFHVCGVGVDGASYCWGWTDLVGTADVSGFLDNEMATPVAVDSGHNFSMLSTGTHHSCGATPAQEAYCWGSNQEAALGSGSIGGHSTVPSLVTGSVAFRSVSAGETHSCGVTDDGRAFCWGGGARGELGSGVFAVPTPSPREVSGGVSFNQLSAGARFTCGVSTDRVAYCWGANDRGQLGVGSTVDTSTPIPVITGARP